MVEVEIRAGGDLNRSEKPGWSAGHMGKLLRKLLKHPVSPKGVLSSKKLTCSKSAKRQYYFYTYQTQKNYLKFYK